MATTPEGWVKKAVKELLEHWGVYYHMPVQNGMGKPSLDFICCARGKFFAIEAKAPGKSPTTRQRLTMQAIAAAGGAAHVVDSWSNFDWLWLWLGGGNGRENMPVELRVKWRRYFANAGGKDAHQPDA